MQSESFVNNFCYKFILRYFVDKEEQLTPTGVESLSVSFLDEILDYLCIISQPSAHLLTCGTSFGNQK